jgi:hypothetical protein
MKQLLFILLFAQILVIGNTAFAQVPPDIQRNLMCARTKSFSIGFGNYYPCVHFINIALGQLWCNCDTAQAIAQLKQAQFCTRQPWANTSIERVFKAITNDLTRYWLNSLSKSKKAKPRPTTKPTQVLAVRRPTFFEQLRIDSTAFAQFSHMTAFAYHNDSITVCLDTENLSATQSGAALSILLERLDSLYGRAVTAVRITQKMTFHEQYIPNKVKYHGEFGLLWQQGIQLNGKFIQVTIPQELPLSRTQSTALTLFDLKTRLQRSMSPTMFLPDPVCAIETTHTIKDVGIYLTFHFKNK